MSAVDPLHAADLMVATIAAALLVVAGAAYAALLALARIARRRRSLLIGVAYASFAGLAGCAIVLADRLDLSGPWRGAIGVLVAGHLVAPHLILRLSIATHEMHEPAEEPEP